MSTIATRSEKMRRRFFVATEGIMLESLLIGFSPNRVYSQLLSMVGAPLTTVDERRQIGVASTQVRLIVMSSHGHSSRSKMYDLNGPLAQW